MGFPASGEGHTWAHTCTHRTCASTHMGTCAGTYLHTGAHTGTHTGTCVCTHLHTRAHTSTSPHAHTGTHACASAHTQTRTHTHTQPYIYPTHACTDTCAHATHMHTCTPTHIHMGMGTRTSTHVPAHTHGFPRGGGELALVYSRSEETPTQEKTNRSLISCGSSPRGRRWLFTKPPRSPPRLGGETKRRREAIFSGSEGLGSAARGVKEKKSPPIITPIFMSLLRA